MVNAGVPGWGSPASPFDEDANVTRDDDSGGRAAHGEPDAEPWTPAERALLDAALEFYAAAEGVIDFAATERPQLRQDADGFKAVREAMGALEEQVLAAHATGVAPERIAEIARIEREMVILILQRRGAAPAPSGD